MNYSFCHEAWLSLEPHHELFQRAQARVKALRSQLKEDAGNLCANFERQFTEILENALQPWGIDLDHLQNLIGAIDQFESKMEQPLLYSFQVKFSRQILEKLHHMHSLLFNLRTLIALDHNAYIQDPTHEALKVDSITDYMPKAEYVTNDALLYLNYRNQRPHVKNPTRDNLDRSFKQFCHNGYCLIEGLPKNFLSQLRVDELEETLYLVQMDWLLGSETGLLFKIREEIFSLTEGYEKIFWHDAELKPIHHHNKLEVNCLLTEKDVMPTTEAA